MVSRGAFSTLPEFLPDLEGVNQRSQVSPLQLWGSAVKVCRAMPRDTLQGAAPPHRGQVGGRTEDLLGGFWGPEVCSDQL